jgi:hypothetical protein
MKTWSKYEKYEKVWNLWKEEEFGIFVTWEWGHCVLCTLCSLERPWRIFLVKSCQLPISPRPFIGICVFVGRCFTTCLHFWLGHTTPYAPKVANHFVSCAQVHCHAPSKCCFVWLYYIFRNLHSSWKKEKHQCLVCGF